MTRRISKNKRAASPAISTVIITAVTVVLVLITGTYANQVLERQRGSAELETVKKSILSFDDAIRDVAWDRDSSRSVRFTVNYGDLRLLPDALTLAVSVQGYQNASYSSTTGYVRYSISTSYVTMGEGTVIYLLGSSDTVSTESTGSAGRVCSAQTGSWINTTLSYGVKAMKIYTVQVNQTSVSYVDIWIVKLKMPSARSYINDFSLVARSPNITSISYGGADGSGYNVIGGQCTINVQIGNDSSSVTIPLDGSKVVFNFLVSEVNVSA